MPDLLPTPDQPPAPFVWGAGGAQMTPERIAAERKVAQAMMAQGMDYSPIRSPFQGAARVAQALMGAYDDRRLNQSEGAMYNDANKLLLSSPALGGGAPAAAAPAAGAGAAPVPPVPAPAPTVLGDGGQPATPDAEGVYGADATMMPQNTAVAGGPIPRGIRNNNPLNIEAGGFTQGQPGYTGSDGRFAQFQTPDQGVAAASRLLDTYQSKYGLNSVRGIVNRWAPPAEAANNTPGYVASVAGRMGVNPDQPLTPAQRPALIAAMGQFENGRPIPGAAQADPAALPPNATPTQGTTPPGVAPAAAAVAPGVSPGVASVAAAMNPAAQQATAVTRQMPPEVANYVKSLIANPMTRAQGIQILGQYSAPRDQWIQKTGPDGTQTQTNSLTGETKVVDPAPQSVQEYSYYKGHVAPGQEPMDYATWATAKARAGATQVAQNVDLNATQTYDKQLAEGLGKSHAALSNGVEDAQARARDLAAMQGAVDAIQKNGGTTGGMGQQQILDLKKTINTGAAAIGITTPFNENDISDKEFLAKFNRQMAGAQAKGAVGGRVTNFEMANYLKANAGLDMSVTGNQRLIGIQSQIEQRNIAVGNAIRQATASAISKGQKIDPVTVQKIITDYDEQHHVADPVSGQDLTQSYALPEFQTGGSNATLAVGHETNIGGIKIKRVQ